MYTKNKYENKYCNQNLYDNKIKINKQIKQCPYNNVIIRLVFTIMILLIVYNQDKKAKR